MRDTALSYANTHDKHPNMGTPMLGTGKIQSALEDVYMVVGPVGMVRARRAAGCLLAPEKNDTVLVMLGAEGNYVLHVLERHTIEARMVLPQHTTIESEKAQGMSSSEHKSCLHIISDTVIMHGAEHIALDAPSTHMTTQNMHIAAHMLRMSGRVLQKQFFSVRDMCAHMFARVGKALHCYGKRTERVDDVLDTQAGRVRLTAEKSVRVRAKDADIRAQEVVTVDGKHVHIG